MESIYTPEMRMGGESIKLFGFVDFRKESVSFGRENSGAKRIRSTEKHSGCTPVFGVRAIFSNVHTAFRSGHGSGAMPVGGEQ